MTETTKGCKGCKSCSSGNGLIVKFKKLHPQRDKDLPMPRYMPRYMTPLPRYMTPHAAGMDIFAAVDGIQIIEPNEIILVGTGLAMAIPHGYEAQIRPRSGLAVKHGITVVNSPGTIDSDYRGEIKVGLINLGKAPFVIRRGERIAQMIIQQVFQAQVRQVETLDETERAGGGFGSTGV